MKLYVVFNGLIYLAILLAHVARLWLEGLSPLGQPVFLASSLASLGAAVWSALIFLRLRVPHKTGRM